MQDIPCGGTAVERAYRELLETLLSRCRALEQAGRRERREALDYYTMWLHQIKTPIAAMNLGFAAGGAAAKGGAAVAALPD